jgi:hypothetical protein
MQTIVHTPKVYAPVPPSFEDCIRAGGNGGGGAPCPPPPPPRVTYH